MNCTKCGATISEADVFCPNCGAKTEQASAPGTFCPDCGTEIFDADAFCPTCGRSTKPNYQAPPQQAYRPPYVPQRPKQSNTGLIIAIIAAVLAFAVAAFALFKIAPKDTNGEPEPTQTAEVAPAPPMFPSISATSTRGYDIDGTTKTTVYYYPDYAVDGDITTAWSSDRKIELTPTITLSADTKQRVSGIRMTNGYCKSEKTYIRNRRITKVKVSYEGGEITTGFDINNYRVMLDIPFDKPVDTRYVSIRVLDSYYGDWKDIAISEIQVY